MNIDLYGGFDTETVNRLGHGEACLLIKEWNTIYTMLEFPSNFRHVYMFLASSPFRRYYCWNMDFDAAAVVHPAFLPWQVCERLALTGSASWRGYCFRYWAGKYLEVRGRDGRGFDLLDLKCFYQMSLAKASKKFLPSRSRKLSIPESWYSWMDYRLRDKRTREKILNYALQDVRALCLLRDKLLHGCHAAGLWPRRLTSPASLATAKWGRAMRACRPPDYINRAFLPALYGGRIEVSALGVVGPCCLFDLHSAYPSVLPGLIDPRGDYIERRGPDWKDKGARYGAYRVRVSVPSSLLFGPFAVRRNNGIILYPVGEFITWMGRTALDLGLKKGWIKEVLLAREIFPKSDARPIFDGVHAMYQGRKDPVMSQPFKLAPNSAFGKMAETASISKLGKDALDGDRFGAHFLKRIHKFGNYTNIPLACEITEKIRLRVWEICQRYGQRVLACMTDGVLISGKPDLETGEGLGEWGLAGEYSRGVILGCGRYYLFNGRKLVKWRLRGFAPQRGFYSKLRSCKRKTIFVPGLEGVSMRNWARGLCLTDFNVLKMACRKLTVCDDKRHFFGWHKSIADYCRKPAIFSLPLLGMLRYNKPWQRKKRLKKNLSKKS